MKTIEVEVANDHLLALTKVRNPVTALAELVWNAFDADAQNVSIKIVENVLTGYDKIVVKDDGTGIYPEDVASSFKSLGGSWKLKTNRTRQEKRLLHGSMGKGRFKAFALGNDVVWSTTYASNGKSYAFQVRGSLINLRKFSVTDAEENNKRETGTTVAITNLVAKMAEKLSNGARDELSESLALYLDQYPNVSVFLNGESLDIKSLKDNVATYIINTGPFKDDTTIIAELVIIEWAERKNRALFLCDNSGFTYQKVPPRIQAPGFSFTAYLKSSFIKEQDSAFGLVDESQPKTKQLLEDARVAMKNHFRARSASAASDLVARWKHENIYPYQGEASDAIEDAERKVFDVVALNINEYLPEFNSTTNSQKQFSFQLIKTAIERGPKELRFVLENVVNLPQGKLEEFASMLEKTELSNIINASRLVMDRLNFLHGLEELIFRHKKHFKERGQLHDIVASETWIFGEQFNLSVNNRSLNEVLRTHIELLGRKDISEEPVLRDDGTKGIIDLMLSRSIPQPDRNKNHHLVIELKRPKKKIDDDVAQQIRSYAIAVASDERFKNTDTSWEFWAISNEMSKSVEIQAEQANLPKGVLFRDNTGTVTVWAVTWGQIIQKCKARISFYQESLRYEADVDSAFAYLKSVHGKYLPESADDV